MSRRDKRQQSEFYSTILPAAELYKLHHAEVVFNSHVLTKQTEFFVWDKSGDPRIPDIPGSWRYFSSIPNFPDYCTMKPYHSNNVVSIKRAALISGRCANNYFHWLIEYLPRLLLLPPSDHISLLADYNIPAQCKEALELVSQGQDVIWTRANTTYRVEELLVPSMLNYSPDSANVPLWAKSALPPDYLTKFRSMVLDLIPNLPTKASRNIFFVRKGPGRNILNIEELLHIAQKYDFEIVDSATLSFIDQVKLAHSAKILVGAAGAAFANILFCQSGARILSLLSKQNRKTSLFSNLANISDCILENVLGHPQWDRKFYPESDSYIHSMYFVSPRKFESTLKNTIT